MEGAKDGRRLTLYLRNSLPLFLSVEFMKLDILAHIDDDC